MSSPFPTLGIALGYLVMVNLGPKLMHNRKPFDLQFLLIPYNLGISMLNLFIGVEVSPFLTFLSKF